jgi:MFS family permease
MNYYRSSILFVGIISCLTVAAHPADACFQTKPHSMSLSSKINMIRGGGGLTARHPTSFLDQKQKQHHQQQRSHSGVPLRSTTVSQETFKPKNIISKMPVLHGLTFLFALSIAMTALAPAPALVAVLGTVKATQLLSYISGASALTEIMCSTAVGATLDKTGRKPAMILATLALATVNASVTLQGSVVAICVAKFVAILSLAFFILGSQAMISDMSISAAASDNEKRIDVSTLLSSAIGANIAVAGAGFLLGIIGGGLLSERGGLPVIFGASTAVALLTATVLSIFMPETLAKSERATPVKAGTSSERWKKILRAPLASAGLLYRHGPQVRILAILLMLMSMPANQGDFFQIYAKTEWGLSTKDFSSYVALFVFVGIFASGFGSSLVKKMGIRKFTSLAIISASFPAIGTTFFGYKGSIIGLFVGFLGAAQSIGIVAALVSAGAKS